MAEQKKEWVSWEELNNLLGAGWTPPAIIDVHTVGGLIPGSIPFADDSGLLDEDNANLFWDAAETNLGIGTDIFGANMERGIQIATGVAPTGGIADTFAFYSKDVGGVAGKAGPHFRTEDNIVIALNQSLLTTDNVEFAALTLVNAINEFSIDGTLGGDSDSAVPTEKAVKLYVDTQIGGVNEFIELTDTPANYAGSAGKSVKVNVAPDGLEFADLVKADITDTPWAWGDVSKVGSNLTDLATRQHVGLTDVTSDQHHAQLHAASHADGLGDELSHDALKDYVIAEHLSLPNTIVNVLSDHDKAAHDALNIDADTVDGEEAAAIVTKARVDAVGPSHDSLADVSVDDHHSELHAAEHEVGGGDLLAFADIPDFGDWIDQAVKEASNVLFGTIGCGTITVADGSSINLEEDITFTGATGVNLIKFPDNLVNALSFMEGANPYMTFVSTDDGEGISLFKTVTLGSIPAGVADYDKFLVSDAGIVKYRTGAEVLADIGGGAGGAAVPHPFLFLGY